MVARIRWIESSKIVVYLPYLLVLARVGAAVLVAPLFATNRLPISIRIAIVFLIALAACPLIDIRQLVARESRPLFELLIAEAVLGLLLGGAVSLVFGCVNLVGDVLERVAGMRWSAGDASADPTGPTSRLLWLISLAVFIFLDGPETFLLAVIETFRVLPPGSPLPGLTQVSLLTELLGHCLRLSLHTLGPALAAYFSGVLMMGIMTKSLPQIDQLMSGLNTNVLLFWGALFLTISGGVWVLHAELPELTGFLANELGSHAPPTLQEAP